MLDKILAKYEEIKTAAKGMIPDVGGHGEMDVPRENPADGREPSIPEAPATGVYIDLRGATIFGYEGFARRVAEPGP